jgi:uncharacterized caspase-like protein
MGGLFHPGLYSQVEVAPLYDAQATRANILNELKKLENCPSQDAVVIFLAGHGLTTKQHFVYLPYDAQITSDQTLAQTGLRSDELTQALSRIPATSQLVVLDCCQAGGATSDFERIRAQQKLARRCGAFLLAASSADQSANEFADLQHGLLTFALLEGLGEGKAPAAALDAEGHITVNHLMDYVSREVPRLSEKHRAKGQDVVQFSTGDDFPIHRP